MVTLAVIIVSWNTRDLLRRCIASVHASLAGSGIDYTVIVVDNASSDGTPAMLHAEHPEVLLLEPGANLGFAGGNNYALRLLLPATCTDAIYGVPTCRLPTADWQHPDYVLLLNPDTEVVGDAIPQLVRYLDTHPNVAVVGPQLRYPDGSPQPSRRRFPSPGVFFWESTPLETRWPGNPWARRYRMADMPDDVEQPVGWLVGAALLVRREAIERAGLLDEGFAMYSEELEWQERICGTGDKETRRQGDKERIQSPAHPLTRSPAHSIMYLPSAVIIHHEGKSSEQAPARRYINFHQSRMRYARMRYGRAFATLLRVFLLAAYSLELAIEAGKWLLGHKRSLRAERMRVYAAVLRGLVASVHVQRT
jgi:GT2 family glycosyltransferase